MDKKELIKYVVAFTYGDGGIYQHGNNARFEATCTEDHRDYVNWRASILKEVTGVRIDELEDKRPNRKLILRTSTQTHPLFTKIRTRMYLSGRKVLDPHYLKLLDWETLAIIYMDDGSLRPNIRTYKTKQYLCTPTPNIATMSFTYAENLLLKQTIKQTLGVEFNVHRHSVGKNGVNYLLDLASSSYEKFIEHISPYILPSFIYKISPYVELSGDRDGEIVRSYLKK